MALDWHVPAAGADCRSAADQDNEGRTPDMTLANWDERGRRRRRRGVFSLVVRWTITLALIVGAGYWSHDIGTRLARQDVARLEERLAEIGDENSRLRTDVAGLKVALRTERDRVAQWQERYRDDVPSDADKALLTQIGERVAGGVSRERLAAVVAITRDEANCADDTVTRRFIVQNPLYGGANDAVSFADNTITVTARGQSSRNAVGAPEAWYDPAAPVTARFTHIGGVAAETTGLLPLHHSLPVGDTEYRFTLLAGARAFVRVTAQFCSYP